MLDYMFLYLLITLCDGLPQPIVNSPFSFDYRQTEMTVTKQNDHCTFVNSEYPDEVMSVSVLGSVFAAISSDYIDEKINFSVAGEGMESTYNFSDRQTRLLKTKSELTVFASDNEQPAISMTIN